MRDHQDNPKQPLLLDNEMGMLERSGRSSQRMRSGSQVSSIATTIPRLATNSIQMPRGTSLPPPPMNNNNLKPPRKNYGHENSLGPDQQQPTRFLQHMSCTTRPSKKRSLLPTPSGGGRGSRPSGTLQYMPAHFILGRTPPPSGKKNF